MVDARWLERKRIAKLKSTIVNADNIVQVQGDAPDEPIYWTGRQWAVTGFGVECRDGTYAIEKERLWENEQEHGWGLQMADKTWVDIQDFMTALLVARGIFAPNPDQDP